MYEKPEIDPLVLIADITDPEERARTAREWGLTDRWNWASSRICAGTGDHARINAATIGQGSFRLGGDREDA